MKKKKRDRSIKLLIEIERNSYIYRLKDNQKLKKKIHKIYLPLALISHEISLRKNQT